LYAICQYTRVILAAVLWHCGMEFPALNKKGPGKPRPLHNKLEIMPAIIRGLSVA
jgi:hypothetical protein